jgi:diadenosine tetraphosphate (Ap4A) HIT family hydrolase
MDNSLMNIESARDPAQRAQMEDLARRGICPFCSEHLKENHREPIEREGVYWVVTKNDYPYEGTASHYLFIHREHITRVEETSPEAFKELREHVAWVAEKFPGGTFLLRSGDTTITGATISHLHAHFIVGGPPQPGGEKIKVSIGHKV